MGKWVRDGGASSNVSKSSLTWDRIIIIMIIIITLILTHLTNVVILDLDVVGRELQRGVIGRPGRVTEVRSLLRADPHVLLKTV